FTLDPTAYTLTFTAQVAKSGVGQSLAVLWGPGLGDLDAQSGRYGVKPEGLYSTGNKVSRLSTSAIGKQPYYQQTFDFAGIDHHYLASFVLKPGAASVQYSVVSIPPPAGSKDPARDLVAYVLTPPAADQPLTWYIGPKDFDTLASIDPNLTRAINFGLFS